MKKGIQSSLFSIVGVLVMAVIIVAANWIAGRAKARIDLTEDRAYTLSDGTRAILAKLDTPVKIRFYATRTDHEAQVYFSNYARVVEGLLEEFREASKGKIEIQKLNPEPSSDAEDSARLDGVEPRMVELGVDPLYLGFSVTMLDAKETEPFLDPREESQLEYKIARAISRVITTKKPVLGVMTPLQMTGSMNPMSMRSGRPPEPWFAYAELKQSYDIKTIEMTADKIPDDVTVLLLVHPKGVTEQAQWAVDQFVLRGGKLMVLLDPFAALDAQGAGQFGASSSSNLDKLLPAWGLKFDSSKVVADRSYVTPMQGGPNPAVLSLTEKAVDKAAKDPLTSNVELMVLGFAGAFSGTPMDGLKQEVLLKSSTDSQLVEPMMAQMGGQQITKDFVASGNQQTLALKLSGKFKTAFPGGKPKAAEPPKPEGEKPEEKKPDAPAEQGLKESTADSIVILIGDTDFIQEPFVGQKMGPLFDPMGSNLAFFLSGVDQLAGDTSLVKVRSRSSRERPFIVMKDMQAEAEKRFQSKIKEVEASRQQFQKRLNEIVRANPAEKSQRIVLSAADQAEYNNVKQKERDADKEIRKLNKDLRADVKSLENRVKGWNIGGMAAVVVVIGVVMSFIRRRRTAAA